MATISHFESERDLVVYDVDGKDTGWRVPVQNPAIDHFYPKEPIAMLWLTYEGHKPTLEDVERPYTITENNTTTQTCDKRTFYGQWAWGSSVKKGRVTLLTRDIPRESGLAAKGEDGFRFNRWLLPNAMYGAGVGSFKVKVLPEHAVFNGLPVEDGFGYISTSFAKAIYNGRKKSEPGRTRDAFHFWQMIPWDQALQEECVPHIQRVFDDYKDMSKWDIDASTGIDLKKKLVALEPRMELHPSVANALLRSSQRRAVRMATSVPTETYSRIAVPTRFSQPVTEGRKIVVTYPIQAYGNIQAFEISPVAMAAQDKALFEAEKARIEAMEVCQYSMSDRMFVAKGLSGVVDDAQLEIDGIQYDAVICAEDIKMVAGQTVSNARKNLHEITVTDGYYGMTMVYAAGVALGMPQPIWKQMGRDYDGDYAYLMSADDRPVLFGKVQAFPDQPTLKLPKSDSSFEHGDIRPKMILDSIEEAILVGAATNMRCTFFSVADMEFLARDRGWHNAMEFLIVADELIRIGTDGFKSKVDIHAALQKAMRLQSNLAARLAMQAPWCKWENDPYLFKHKLPEFARKGMGLDELKQSIPMQMDGTIVQILKLTLPALKTIIETPIEALPLTSFLGWAKAVDKGLIEAARKLQGAYDQRSQKVNWSDPAETRDFYAWMEKRATDFCTENHYTRADGAAALWRVAHSKDSEKAGGMSVFIGFPDQIEAIIKEKPGLRRDQMYILTGVNYALDDTRSTEFDCELEVKLNEFVTPKEGRRTLRKVAISHVSGQKQANPGYPEGCLGTFSKDSKLPEPEEGRYIARIRRNGSARMWFCDLKPCDR